MFIAMMVAMHVDLPAKIGLQKNPSVAIVADIIKQLCDAGADVTIRNNGGRSPVDDVTYQIKYHDLPAEVADYIHDAQFPKSKKVAPKTPSPYQRIPVKVV